MLAISKVPNLSSKLCHPYTSILFIGILYFYFSNTAIGFGDALGFVWAVEKDLIFLLMLRHTLVIPMY